MPFGRAGHAEPHTGRIGWLRPAVLGANDGIVSTSSLLLGVTSAGLDRGEILIAGIAAVAAGAMSMAAAEYVSVSSQSDAQRADLERERRELKADPVYETEELAAIYVDRGLDPDLARQVAERLMRVDPLAAHARDELGISDVAVARPLQAAFTSLVSFSIGGLLPLIMVLIAPYGWLAPFVAGATLILLAILGALAAYTGRARVLRGSLRVTFWGALAMVTTSIIGGLVGFAG